VGTAIRDRRKALVVAAAAVVLACIAGPPMALAKHHHGVGLGPKAELERSDCTPFLVSVADGSNDEKCTLSVHDTQSFRGDGSIQISFLDQRKFKGYEFRDGEDACLGTRTARLYRNGAPVQTVATNSDGSFVFYTAADANDNLAPWPLGSYRVVMAPAKKKAEIVKSKFAGQPFAPIKKLKVACGGASIGLGQPAWYCESGSGPLYTLRTSTTGPCRDDEESL
jgi:hypothetical protein